MSRYARTAPGLNHKITPIRRPFSNFDFVEHDFGAIWPLRRIMSQVRQLGGRTMVVEELPQSEDLREENEDIAIRCPGFSTSASWRLSFFKKVFKSRRGLVTASPEDFLGYAVLKTDGLPGRASETRVYESVLRPSKHPNNFVRGVQRWPCKVAGEEFGIEGYLYAQQNNVTNACAHVALRTAVARFHPDGDMSYREMNRIAGIDLSKLGPGQPCGLTPPQMLAVLDAAGARCFPADYTLPSNQRPNVPFQKYLYGSIESGYPAILLFGTEPPNSYHAVPVFGHTFNEDTWVPDAERSYFRVGGTIGYLPSEFWVSMYIAHDDNWGSNFCIPRHYLHVRRSCDQLNGGPKPCPIDPERVVYAMGTLPKDVQLDAIRAEVIGADYLLTIRPQVPPDAGPWARRLAWYADRRLLVLRPVLIEGREYGEHLEKVRDWDRNGVRADVVAGLKRALTEKLWMVELSVPELFSANRRKLGEVLLRAEIAPGGRGDFRSFVLARVPGYFALYVGGDPDSPRYQFIPSGATGHVELFRCEEGSRRQA